MREPKDALDDSADIAAEPSWTTPPAVMSENAVDEKGKKPSMT
jgi:hypothetical protein